MEELKIGDIIKDRYELVKFLGSGSFGEVWLAHDQVTGRDVGLKIYLSLDPTGIEEFRREYANTIDLSSPYLLTPEYFDVHHRRPFLVMKYCEQGSASKLAGNISEEQLWRFIEDVAKGLEVLHSQPDPIVHQDIKPDNILIDNTGKFMITDFGISKRLRSTMHRQSKRDVSSGAMPYMAPERFESNPKLSTASDIWSLGASIYELATGELPFSGFGGNMQRNGAEMPSLSGKYSPALNEIMRRCLKANIVERPTAKELAEWSINRSLPSAITGSLTNREPNQRNTVHESSSQNPEVRTSTKTRWIFVIIALFLSVGVFFFLQKSGLNKVSNEASNSSSADSVVETVDEIHKLSAEYQILTSKSTIINGQTVHFYKGAFYYGKDIYPVMLCFVSSNGQIITAVYKNVSYGGRIAMNCQSIGNEIRLSGKDGNNDFSIVLSSGEDVTLLGTATDGNKRMTVRIKPTSESFEFTKKSDIHLYSYKLGSGVISIPSFLVKTGETNGGGTIFNDSTNQIELVVQRWWDTDIGTYVTLQHAIYGHGTTLLSKNNCEVESGTTRNNQIYYWKAYLDTNSLSSTLYTAEITYPISRREEMDGLLAKIFNPFPNIK